jgi:hypothetical protein
MAYLNGFVDNLQTGNSKSVTTGHTLKTFKRYLLSVLRVSFGLRYLETTWGRECSVRHFRALGQQMQPATRAWLPPVSFKHGNWFIQSMIEHV